MRSALKQGENQKATLANDVTKDSMKSPSPVRIITTTGGGSSSSHDLLFLLHHEQEVDDPQHRMDSDIAGSLRKSYFSLKQLFSETVFTQS